MALDLLLDNFLKDELKALKAFRLQGTIPIDAVSKYLLDMKKEIIKRHEEFCKIWQASDGRWKTKVPDQKSKSGCRLVAKSKKEDLENYILQYYLNNGLIADKPTLASIYPKWIESKEKETSLGNANKLSYVWYKYYDGAKITKRPLSELTAGEIKDWMLSVIKSNNLSKKQFKELKSLVNMMFDYAISYNYTQINLPRQIRGFSDRIFREDIPAPYDETVYTAATRKEVITEAMKQYEKTGNLAYLAICLNFTLGLRVSELVALSKDCIQKNGTIDIKREEVKKYYKDDNGKIHRKGYEVINRTKTSSGIRNLVLTPKAKELIKMAIDKNIERGFADAEFIFLDKKGNRLHDFAINNVLRRLNGTRNEKDAFDIVGHPSGNHAIRKTCISELHDSLKLSDDAIKAFAGHKDISTTQKCYIHQIKPVTEFRPVFTDVFDAV